MSNYQMYLSKLPESDQQLRVFRSEVTCSSSFPLLGAFQPDQTHARGDKRCRTTRCTCQSFPRATNSFASSDLKLHVQVRFLCLAHSNLIRLTPEVTSDVELPDVLVKASRERPTASRLRSLFLKVTCHSSADFPRTFLRSRTFQTRGALS